MSLTLFHEIKFEKQQHILKGNIVSCKVRKSTGAINMTFMFNYAENLLPLLQVCTQSVLNVINVQKHVFNKQSQLNKFCANVKYNFKHKLLLRTVYEPCKAGNCHCDPDYKSTPKDSGLPSLTV